LFTFTVHKSIIRVARPRIVSEFSVSAGFEPVALIFV
jgi:hypothetical protein